MSSNQNQFSSENPYKNVPLGSNPPTESLNPTTQHHPAGSQDTTGFRQGQGEEPYNPATDTSYSQQGHHQQPNPALNTQVPTYEIDAGVVESPTRAKGDTGLDPFQDTSNQDQTAGGAQTSGYGGTKHEPFNQQQQQARGETGDHAYAPGAVHDPVTQQEHQHHLGTAEPPSTSANAHAKTTAFTGIAPGQESHLPENKASHTSGPTSEHYSQPGVTPDTRTTGQKLKSVGGELKSMAAGIHGIGEKIRGEFNSGVDRAAGDQAGLSKNEQIKTKGEGEMYSGKFGHGTGAGAGVGGAEARTGVHGNAQDYPAGSTVNKGTGI